MDPTRFTYITLSPRAAVSALLLFFATVATLVALGSPASAEGGDGGGGPNPGDGTGDGCLLTGWDFTRGPGGIKLVSGADGDLCGNPSNQLDGLRSEGAGGCANNASDVVALWYVVDRSGSWATSNTGGADTVIQSRAHLKLVIDNTPNSQLRKPNGEPWPDYSPARIKDMARESIARDNFNTVVCVWLGQPTSNYTCSDLSDWGKYVAARGPGARFSGPVEAQRYCFEKCPNTSPRNAGRLIPIGYANNRSGFCGMPMSYTEIEYYTTSWCATGSGELTTFDPTSTTSAPLPYYWRTVVDNGGPHPGPTQLEPQEASKYSPLGQLFHANPNPSLEQVTEAVKAGLTSDHAVVARLSATNERALAEGGVMNVREWTTYVRTVTTTNRRIVTPYTSCTIMYQAQERSRSVVQQQEDYRTWGVWKRSRYQVQDGVVCGSGNVPATAAWSENTGNACVNTPSKNRWRYGHYEWTDWAWDRKEEGASCPASDNNTDIRNCESHTRDVVTYGAWTSWVSTGSPWAGETTITYGTPATVVDSVTTSPQVDTMPQLTAFWQTLSAHCNSGEYSAASTGFEKLNTAIDPTAKHSGAAVTPKMAGGNNPAWGAGALNPKGTNSTGFFDKQCAFEGELVEAGDPHAERVFFRDNELRDVVVGLYRPVTTGVVRDDGMNALATVVTRWALGTPQVNNVTNKGAFRTFSNEGDQMFAPGNDPAPVFRNWMTFGTDTALTWSVLSGQEHHFLMAGNWASDSGKPNVFTTKWIFAPQVASRLPVTQVGFGGTAGARSFGTSDISTKIQGQVMGKTDGSPTTPALTQEIEANTGSGVAVNTLDPNLLGGAPTNRWASDPTANGYFNAIRFVRAIGS